MNCKIIIFLFLLIFSITSCKTNELALSKNYNTSDMALMKYTIDSLNNEIDILKSDQLITKAQKGTVVSRCGIDPIFETVKYKYNIYTGTDKQLPYVQKVNIVRKPKYSQWIKLSIINVCQTNNERENNCEMWQLKQNAAEIETVYEVTDTTKTKEYEIKSFEVYELLRETELTNWFEIQCSQGHPDIYKKVKIALINIGYDLNGGVNNVIDRVTIDALIDYQKKNNLPVGQLNIETLKSLGIE